MPGSQLGREVQQTDTGTVQGKMYRYVPANIRQARQAGEAVNPARWMSRDYLPHPARVAHWNAMYNWAKQVPAENWTTGPPPTKPGTYYAVKTETGRILVGGSRAFVAWKLSEIARNPKYGRIVAHLEIGD